MNRLSSALPSPASSAASLPLCSPPQLPALMPLSSKRSPSPSTLVSRPWIPGTPRTTFPVLRRVPFMRVSIHLTRISSRRPQLAESVDISPDGRVYTFKLRQGVKFHDGTILDAEAVKLSFELGASQDLKRTRRNFFNFVEKIEAADKYTVRFTLKSPMTAFLERLSNGTAAIACPSLLRRAKTKQALAFEACGTGPYKLVRFNPAEELLVERNPDYRVPGLPKFKALRWVPVVENSTRAAMLQTGEAQFIQMAPWSRFRF